MKYAWIIAFVSYRNSSPPLTTRYHRPHPPTTPSTISSRSKPRLPIWCQLRGHQSIWHKRTADTENVPDFLLTFRMWLMSDRALPRSFAMMEGFGIHTFRFINAQNVSHFVKFHWKPVLGINSLVWDEVQKLAGFNPDFNRQQMWNSIEAGNYLQFELGLQVLEEGDELKYGFDILDATKLIPEELVPVQIVGRMVLNRYWTRFITSKIQDTHLRQVYVWYFTIARSK